MIDLDQLADSISDREDLAAFILALRQDLLTHSEAPEWENPSLDGYLEALAAWIVDMDGFFTNRGRAVPDQPDWQLVGSMLLAAKVYE